MDLSSFTMPDVLHQDPEITLWEIRNTVGRNVKDKFCICLFVQILTSNDRGMLLVYSQVMRHSWTWFGVPPPPSSKRLSPSNRADLQYLNWYSIWIASTKQVGIIRIRGAATACQPSYISPTCYSNVFKTFVYISKMHVDEEQKAFVLATRGCD